MKGLHATEGDPNGRYGLVDAQFLATLSHRGNKLGGIQGSHVRVPIARARERQHPVPF
nr:hypothetical protein [Arthrobacter sp. Leaf337]